MSNKPDLDLILSLFPHKQVNCCTNRGQHKTSNTSLRSQREQVRTRSTTYTCHSYKILFPKRLGYKRTGHVESLIHANQPTQRFYCHMPTLRKAVRVEYSLQLTFLADGTVRRSSVLKDRQDTEQCGHTE